MINVEQISYSYSSKVSSKPVLNNFSLDIKIGELYGLVGPNGSGKTTFAKLLIGFLEPSCGRILVNGQPRPSVSSSAWKEQVGMVSGAATKLFSTIDLDEHVALYSRIYRRFDTQHFLKSLERLGIRELKGRRTNSLSFGERIKFEIALTLAHRPRVLVLDEPTVGLDPLAIQQVRQEIKTYCSENGAFGVLTSHNLRDIVEVSLRGGFLHSGNIVFEFSSKEQTVDLLEEKYREVYA